MAVTCSECGEELLGAVNRCWRCGTPVVSHRGAVETPPIRRAPIGQIGPEGGDAPPKDDVVVAMTVGDDHSESNGDHDPPVVARRIGSPFASPVGGTDSMDVQPSATTYIPATRPDYPQHAGAWGGTLAALFLGVLSFLLAFNGLTAMAALPLSMLGLLMAIWGLYSGRRAMAITAVLFCCVTMAIAGFNTAIYVYEKAYGVNPWQTNDPYDPMDDPAYLDGEFNQSLEP